MPSRLQRTRVEDSVRQDIWGIEPYAAVQPMERLAERAGVTPERVLKLDANENPYGCSPKVAKALASYDWYHIYPDPLCSEIRALLSAHAGVAQERIVVGNGSDEIIDLVFRLFAGPGDRIMSFPPTFGYYRSSADTYGIGVLEVPRTASYEIDVEEVLSRIDSTVKVMVIASPNNPTGKLLPQSDLLRLLEPGVAVIVDEAYGEFAGESMMPLTARFDNLIVVRTFSKWAGLAGLRFGYGVLSATLAEQIMKIKPPYNVNVAAQVAAKVSLADLDYLLDKVSIIVRERERLFCRLQELDFLEPLPSSANFILCRITRGSLHAVRARLEREGIFFRYYGDPALASCVRMSVGAPEQNDRVIETLRSIGADLEPRA